MDLKNICYLLSWLSQKDGLKLQSIHFLETTKVALLLVNDCTIFPIKSSQTCTLQDINYFLFCSICASFVWVFLLLMAVLSHPGFSSVKTSVKRSLVQKLNCQLMVVLSMHKQCFQIVFWRLNWTIPSSKLHYVIKCPVLQSLNIAVSSMQFTC